MMIKRGKVNSDTVVDIAPEVTPVVEPVEVVAPVEPAVPECPYECAILKICEAIECLGPLVADDVKAQEAVADLSVILFDLK